ncbi:hypothetical protein MSG28_001521 [Choristoneura fumiferana]|uniref:Uncharacterized protein n=1 Tax=Choristoneura fumiferana TaxID=7141 RepID=A0ACC0KUY3_CHOFU|nr:hypothetical protein MSG28_001521 [Choristoneura fumiferana]
MARTKPMNERSITRPAVTMALEKSCCATILAKSLSVERRCGRCGECGSTVEHLVGSGAGGLMPGAAPAQHPPNMLQPMEEMILPPKRQAVVDRLRRRLDIYRRRQIECVPRFDQSFTGACEQQNLETNALQKRFLEGKAKRQAKKSDRKPDLPSISGNLHSSVHVAVHPPEMCEETERCA